MRQRIPGIAEEKYKWLSKYASFIKRENWIVINKEKGEYSSENRNIIKTLKMQEKLNKYDHVILLDDDHKILKETVLMLNDKTHVYHVSSVDNVGLSAQPISSSIGMSIPSR